MIPKIAVGVLRGVAYLHSQGVAHRDLKPGNILLSNTTGELQVKLTDFGESWGNIVNNTNAMKTHTVNVFKGRLFEYFLSHFGHFFTTLKA